MRNLHKIPKLYTVEYNHYVLVPEAFKITSYHENIADDWVKNTIYKGYWDPDCETHVNQCALHALAKTIGEIVGNE